MEKILQTDVRIMDDLGRISIPKHIRSKIGANEGDSFSIILEDGKIVIEPIDILNSSLLTNLLENICNGDLGTQLSKNLSKEQTEQLIGHFVAAKDIMRQNK